MKGILPRKRVFLAVLLAMMVPVAAMGTPVFMPNAEGPVDDADALVCGGVCVGVAVVGAFASGALVADYLSGDDKGATYSSADADQTDLDVYQHAKTIRDGGEKVDTIMNNQVVDGSHTVAWAKGKMAVIEAMNNGSNLSVAKQAGVDAIEDYYSTMEVNIIRQTNDEARKIVYLQEVFESHPDHSGVNKFYAKTAAQGLVDPGGRTQNGTYTLLNGSTAISTEIGHHDGAGGTTWTGITANTDTWVVYGMTINGTTYSDADVMNLGERESVLTNITNANNQMVSNIELWSDNIYPTYQAGDINTTDLVDPTTISQEAATDYNSTGYHAYAAADLLIQGVNASMNHSMEFTVWEDSDGDGNYTDQVTYNGSLYTDVEPANGSWETGVKYDTSTFSKMVFLATEEKGLVMLEDEFRIESMTNVKTGESVNSTKTQQYVRQTADPGMTLEELRTLLELQDELSQAQAAAAGAAGGLPFGLSKSEAAVGGAGLGALYLLSRRPELYN